MGIMRKKRLIIAFACTMLFGMTGCAASIGKKPFKDLKASEISFATVCLTPPDKTLQITNLEELTEYLKATIIYKKDNSYTEYAGQGVLYTLTMTDGTQTKIMAYNPFLVIDGVGYQTKYQPCKKLNQYANRLMDEENVPVILEKPPALSIMAGHTSIGALLGTYSWQHKNRDGSISGENANGAHPLDCKDLFVPFETTETAATLHFSENPDKILNVRCWSEAHYANPTAKSQKVSVDGYKIILKPGGYIYEVKAEWNRESGYGGIAYYSFYVKTSEKTVGAYH